ncbi:hypothetical protein SSX86_000028 [Deinandra increscens subsp. villosa]|uniref:DUF4408 domain-containing protein n=1 Tax=Deinandra increscens subsp. villosa TaxID=3103831 RepID=A0AAP0DTR0_9ASTR
MGSLSLKLALLSATVLSTAVIFNLSPPLTTAQFAISDLPVLYTSLTSWLKPPYLYVLINCIIITIVASSRLQSSKIDGSHHHTFPPSYEPVKVGLPVDYEPVKVTYPVDLSPVHIPPVHVDYKPVKVAYPVDLSPVHIPPVHVPEVVASVHEPVKISESKPEVIEVPEYHAPELPDKNETLELDEDMKIAKEAYEEIKKSRVNNKSVISMSTWMPSDMNEVGLSFPVEKPPASARFSHRKLAKATPEGGRTLGVTKPKKQDTLEGTWKAITDGRSIPLTRHLRKSDTWETHGPSRENRNTDNHPERMTKSETFDVKPLRKPVKPPPAPSKLRKSGGSGRLKKEPSLGQEELNRKVEAFIKKVNEDMRLQRQESLNQYMEMINRGAH